MKTIKDVKVVSKNTEELRTSADEVYDSSDGWES